MRGQHAQRSFREVPRGTAGSQRASIGQRHRRPSVGRAMRGEDPAQEGATTCVELHGSRFKACEVPKVESSGRVKSSTARRGCGRRGASIVPLRSRGRRPQPSNSTNKALWAESQHTDSVDDTMNAEVQLLDLAVEEMEEAMSQQPQERGAVHVDARSTRQGFSCSPCPSRPSPVASDLLSTIDELVMLTMEGDSFRSSLMELRQFLAEDP